MSSTYRSRRTFADDVREITLGLRNSRGTSGNVVAIMALSLRGCAMLPMAVTLEKCSHSAAVKLITAYPSSATITEVFHDVHPALGKGYSVKAVAGSDWEVDWGLTVADVTAFGLKTI